MVWSSWFTDIPWFTPKEEVSDKQKQEFIEIFDAYTDPFIMRVAGANAIVVILLISVTYAFLKKDILFVVIPASLIAALLFLTIAVIEPLSKIISNQIRNSIQKTGSLLSGFFQREKHD